VKLTGPMKVDQRANKTVFGVTEEK
jgi:hypothetical protein